MMIETLKKSKMIKLLLLTGAVYFFLEYISPLLGPVLIAMLFVTIFGPLLKGIQKKLHIHRQVGALLLLLAAGVVLTVFVWILFSWIVGSLPEWLEWLEMLEQETYRLLHSVCQIISRLIGVDSAYLEETISGYLRDWIGQLGAPAVPGMISRSFKYVKAAGMLGGFLVTFIIAAVLLAKDYDDIMNRLLDNEEYHVFLEVICGVIRYIATYVKAQIVIMAMIGLLAAAVLGLTGIEHGVLWGIVAGILDALPFVGTGIVLVPLTVSQLIQGCYGRAAVCLLLYAACAFLREFTEPRLIGRRIGVSPIAVLVSLYAGIRLFGVWGIVKGPLGFVLIYQTWLSIRKREKASEEG